MRITMTSTIRLATPKSLWGYNNTGDHNPVTYDEPVVDSSIIIWLECHINTSTVIFQHIKVGSMQRRDNCLCFDKIVWKLRVRHMFEMSFNYLRRSYYTKKGVQKPVLSLYDKIALMIRYLHSRWTEFHYLPIFEIVLLSKQSSGPYKSYSTFSRSNHLLYMNLIRGTFTFRKNATKGKSSPRSTTETSSN